MPHTPLPQMPTWNLWYEAHMGVCVWAAFLFFCQKEIEAILWVWHPKTKRGQLLHSTYGVRVCALCLEKATPKKGLAFGRLPFLMQKLPGPWTRLLRGCPDLRAPRPMALSDLRPILSSGTGQGKTWISLSENHTGLKGKPKGKPNTLVPQGTRWHLLRNSQPKGCQQNLNPAA